MGAAASHSNDAARLSSASNIDITSIIIASEKVHISHGFNGFVFSICNATASERTRRYASSQWVCFPISSIRGRRTNREEMGLFLHFQICRDAQSAIREWVCFCDSSRRVRPRFCGHSQSVIVCRLTLRRHIRSVRTVSTSMLYRISPTCRAATKSRRRGGSAFRLFF